MARPVNVIGRKTEEETRRRGIDPSQTELSFVRAVKGFFLQLIQNHLDPSQADFSCVTSYSLQSAIVDDC